MVCSVVNTVVTCTMTFDFHTSSLKNLRASRAEKTEAEGSMRFAKIPQIVYDEVRAGALVHNIYINVFLYNTMSSHSNRTKDRDSYRNF